MNNHLCLHGYPLIPLILVMTDDEYIKSWSRFQHMMSATCVIYVSSLIRGPEVKILKNRNFSPQELQTRKPDDRLTGQIATFGF